MQKLSTTKFNLFMKSFQGVPSQVACSKLGTFPVPDHFKCMNHKPSTNNLSCSIMSCFSDGDPEVSPPPPPSLIVILLSTIFYLKPKKLGYKLKTNHNQFIKKNHEVFYIIYYWMNKKTRNSFYYLQFLKLSRKIFNNMNYELNCS